MYSRRSTDSPFLNQSYEVQKSTLLKLFLNLLNCSSLQVMNDIVSFNTSNSLGPAEKIHSRENKYLRLPSKTSLIVSGGDPNCIAEISVLTKYPPRKRD